MAYRGIKATFPIGLQGIHGARNPSKLQPGHLTASEGLDIDQGVLVKEGGADKLNTVSLGAVIRAGWNWSPAPNDYRNIVLLEGGSVRQDINSAGTFATTMRSGLADPVIYPPTFCECGGEAVGATRKLLMFTDTNQVQITSGTSGTMADISDPAADWASEYPLFGVQHAQRVFAGGNGSDPHRIYYTTTADHQDFAGGGTLAVFPGEGDGIVGGVSFRGLLLVWKKPRGIYVIDTRDPTVANWSVQKLSGAVGAAGPRCIVPKDNDILFLDPSGTWHLMSAVQDFGDLDTSDLGRLMDIRTYMRRNANIANLVISCGVWYADRSKAYYHIPQLGDSDTCGLRMVIDFSDDQFGPRFLPSTRDEGPALWLHRDADFLERPMLGDSDGFAWLLDEEDRDKDGASYITEFETSNNDFSFLEPELGGSAKNGQFLEIVSDLVNQTDVTVVPVWDGQPGDPIEFNLGAGAAALDSFELDLDTLGYDGIVVDRRRLNGQGRRLKLIFRNEELADEMRISEVRVEFQVADERIKQTG